MFWGYADTVRDPRGFAIKSYTQHGNYDMVGNTDLYQAIGRRDHPAWTLRMQIMPFEEAAGYRFNPFDVAKVWPHGDYSLVTVGRLILDRNPENYLQLPVCNRPSAPAGDLRE